MDKLRERGKIMKNATRICILFLSAALIMALTSCGGGGDGSDVSAPDTPNATLQSTGTVGILLTDKPADLSVFASINATIESIELLGNEEDRIPIYSGPSKTFDLLKLTHEAIPFTFKDDVPIGTYCKIRMTLSDLELVFVDPEKPTEHPKLPGNGKLDLVARKCFDVGPGEVVTLQIDIDAGNSIHIVGNKKGYNFRPVVFVDVLSENFDGKLVRLDGQITEVDEDQQSLLLCDAVPMNYMNTMGCVEVDFGEDAAFFDNKDFGGTPRPLDELFSQDKLGEEISIVGWPRHWVEPSPYADVPEGYYPRLGECVLWNINLEAGQQPPPIACDQIPEPLPDNNIVVDHSGVVKDIYYPFMKLDALVAELGEFLQLNGYVTENADISGFYMNVREGEPILTHSPLGVVLQEGPVGVNGTRIVSKSGVLLDFSSVIVPKMVQVDGTLNLMEAETLLFAALVIVDTKGSETEQVTGTILGVDADRLTLAPETETVCGTAVEQLVVGYSLETEIYTVIINEPNVTIVPGGTLETGQNVGISVFCDPPVYSAESIVIVEDQRP
jgi:hypothetical protein